jgi:hypothetical protein
MADCSSWATNNILMKGKKMTLLILRARVLLALKSKMNEPTGATSTPPFDEMKAKNLHGICFGGHILLDSFCESSKNHLKSMKGAYDKLWPAGKEGPVWIFNSTKKLRSYSLFISLMIKVQTQLGWYGRQKCQSV